MKRATLSAVGYNLRLILAWLRMILRTILLILRTILFALIQAFAIRVAFKCVF